MATMYAISQQHPYAYAACPAPAPVPPRYCSNHGTSSAFSSSAHPDEDWTKISDLAERRRIQNRIAQRNYRKKLKRRLEDLERRACSEEGDAEKPAVGNCTSSNNSNKSSSSSSSSSSHTTHNTCKVTKRQATKSKATHAHQPHAPNRSSISPKPTSVVSQGQFTPPMESHEELMGYHHHPHHHHYDDRERSHTPPVFAYTTYPAPDELLMNPYGAGHPYPAITTAEAYGSHLASAPTTSAMSTPSLPSISHYSNPIKREVYQEHMSPYVGYAYLPPPDMNLPSPYESAPLTPPLSHSYESAPCSEPGFEYPSTPLSMSGSPCMMSHHHPHH